MAVLAPIPRARARRAMAVVAGALFRLRRPNRMSERSDSTGVLPGKARARAGALSYPACPRRPELGSPTLRLTQRLAVPHRSQLHLRVVGHHDEGPRLHLEPARPVVG